MAKFAHANMTDAWVFPVVKRYAYCMSQIFKERSFATRFG
jgi:hypothetical protein